MSGKRIINVFKRDFSNSLRDKMIIYLFIAPMLMAFALKIFVPDVQKSTFKFAVLNNTDEVIVSHLNEYGKVFKFEDYSSLQNRINQYDDVIGIVIENGSPKIVAQGNEEGEAGKITQLILLEQNSSGTGFIKFSDSNIGSKMPPFTMFSFIFVIMISFLMGGLAIGFNIIEEKESSTVKALSVTPMTRGDFLLGKSVVGFLMPLIHAPLAIWVLGISGVNYPMLFVITMFSSLIGIIMGFLIGVLSSNQMNGIANMKVTSLVMLLPMMLAFLLPESRHIFLYWAPTYWTYVALKDLILNLQTWRNLVPQLAGILITTGFVLLLVKSKIRVGLSAYK